VWCGGGGGRRAESGRACVVAGRMSW
jgi:hypothetical protein